MTCRLAVHIALLREIGVEILEFTGHLAGAARGIEPRDATNAALAERKREWIDFDASPTLYGNDLTDELFEYIIKVAEGEETKNEIHDYREISIFKDGVTL